MNHQYTFFSKNVFAGILSLLLLLHFATAQTNYPLSFQYLDSSGAQHVQPYGRAQIHFMGTGKSMPYLKWMNAPFAITYSGIAPGIGLFTDSVSSFSAGQEVGWAFTKTGSSGVFMQDYVECNIGMFINNSQSPNVKITSTPQGLRMTALANIAPNTEIKASYADILALFPNDNTATFLIKYW